MSTQLDSDDFGEELTMQMELLTAEEELEQRAQGLTCDQFIPAARPVTMFPEQPARRRMWPALAALVLIAVATVTVTIFLVAAKGLEEPAQSKPQPTPDQQNILDRLERLERQMGR
jgi:hypothetical protein